MSPPCLKVPENSFGWGWWQNLLHLAMSADWLHSSVVLFRQPRKKEATVGVTEQQDKLQINWLYSLIFCTSLIFKMTIIIKTEDPFLQPRGSAMWVLIRSCTSCGSLHHASAFSALPCFTTGTASGEPITIVRHAGDSCTNSNPHPPTLSPAEAWEEYCRSS